VVGAVSLTLLPVVEEITSIAPRVDKLGIEGHRCLSGRWVSQLKTAPSTNHRWPAEPPIQLNILQFYCCRKTSLYLPTASVLGLGTGIGSTWRFPGPMGLWEKCKEQYHQSAAQYRHFTYSVATAAATATRATSKT